jgi:hypothetical protein
MVEAQPLDLLDVLAEGSVFLNSEGLVPHCVKSRPETCETIHYFDLPDPHKPIDFNSAIELRSILHTFLSLNSHSFSAMAQYMLRCT